MFLLKLYKIKVLELFWIELDIRVSLKMEKSTNIKYNLGNVVFMSYEQNKKRIKILAQLFDGSLRVFIL